MDVKMGTGESTQSSELGINAGFANQSAFNRQSPNVARLIRSETSSKMEYEFPITDVPNNSSTHHHHHINNHSIIPGSLNRTTLQHPNALPLSQQPINHTSPFFGTNDNITHGKLHSNQTSNMWLTITSCFGCRKRGSINSSTNSLRDKVHAIRIVRASNDLTPAVFDSHYNIITLEQLRECDNNTNLVPNEFADEPSSQTSNAGAAAQNGNGSVIGSSSSSSVKKDNSHRMKKKRKKRATQATNTSKTAGSDDDDDDEGSGRTYQ